MSELDSILAGGNAIQPQAASIAPPTSTNNPGMNKDAGGDELSKYLATASQPISAKPAIAPAPVKRIDPTISMPWSSGRALFNKAMGPADNSTLNPSAQKALEKTQALAEGAQNGLSDLFTKTAPQIQARVEEYLGLKPQGYSTQVTNKLEDQKTKEQTALQLKYPNSPNFLKAGQLAGQYGGTLAIGGGEGLLGKAAMGALGGGAAAATQFLPNDKSTLGNIAGGAATGAVANPILGSILNARPSAETLENAANVAKTGIQQTLGQLMESPIIRSLESKGYPTVKGELYAKQAGQAYQYLNNLMDNIKTGDVTTGFGSNTAAAGESPNIIPKIQGALDSTISAMRQARSANFSAALNKAQNVLGEGKIIPTSNVAKAVDDLAAQFSHGTDPNANKTILNGLQTYKQGLQRNGGASSILDVQQDLHQFTKAEDGSGGLFDFTNTDKATRSLVANKLQNALLSDLQAAGQNSALNQEGIQHLLNARQAYKEDSAGIDQIRNSVIGKMFSSDKLPVMGQVVQRLGFGKSVGGRGATPAESKFVMGLLDQANPDVANGVRQAALGQMVQKSINQNVGAWDNPFQTDKFLGQMPSDDKLQAIFQPDQYNNIKSGMRAMQLLKAKYFNPSELNSPPGGKEITNTSGTTKLLISKLFSSTHLPEVLMSPKAATFLSAMGELPKGHPNVGTIASILNQHLQNLDQRDAQQQPGAF